MSNYLVFVALLLPFFSFAENIEEIEAMWQNGQSSFLKKDYEQAFINCDQGIEQLGKAYTSQNVLDDTGQALVLAESSAKDGNYKTAASASCRSLKTRIALYKRKFKDVIDEAP